jgi:hypothetical protein
LGRVQAHQRDVNATDARLWHPWLRINCVLRVWLHSRLERGGVVSGQARVQEGARTAARSGARAGSAEYLGRSDLDGGVEGDRL